MTNSTANLEMRWLPVTDEATGRTRMEAVWITVAQAPVTAQPVTLHSTPHAA